MATRALGSATISFGLVSIPIKMFTTTAAGGGGPSFNWLHGCGSRVKQQYWCPRCERVAPREELVKGYEFAKGQYVTFTPDELRALEETGSEAIEIHSFLPLAAIDPLFYERAYYLGPDKGAAKPYRLLAEAMERTDRAALASWSARGKQYLVLIRPFEDGLVLQQLRYAEEVRPFAEIDRGEATVKPAELDLAVRLIEQISEDAFHPEQYRDAVRDRIEAAVRAKVEGEEAISLEPAAAPEARIIDLMDALRASLEGGGEAPARRGPRRAAARQQAQPQPARARRARGRARSDGAKGR